MNKEILHYITTTTSWQIKKIRTYTKESITLPIHIFNKFDIAKYRLEKVDVLFLKAKGDVCDGKLLKHYTDLIGRTVDIAVVFVLDDCDASKIQNLIKYKINFIVPDRYIYLPFALMQIETTKRKKTRPILTAKLDNTAKMILIAYLSGWIKSPITGAEIAKKLEKQPIVISKALHTLEQMEYISFKKQGRQKIVRFIEKHQTWKQCKHALYTPVKEILFTNSDLDSDLFLYSGISALSKETNLAQERLRTVAVYKRDFNRIKDELHFTDKKDARYLIEVWDIDPKILSYKEMVNPLYLVVNFLYEEDERIRIALEELVEKHNELAFLKEEIYA